MKLIYSDASPYARTVRILVRELDLLERIEEINLHPFDNPAQLISFNPLCRVPCLIDELQNGIFDSAVISDYLLSLKENTFNNLIAKDWQLRTELSLSRGILDSCVAWQQDKMRGDAGESEFWQVRFKASIERGLNYLQKRLAGFPKQFSPLHINLITILEYLDFRHPDYEWREQHAGLLDWYQDYATRDSVSETKPK